MSNTCFQFKQFMIHQDRCAMKVCTDACLFGAWAAKEVESWVVKPESILDIGCGTGLLGLLLAQKTNAFTDAIEIDREAAEQASENFEASAWNNRLQVINGDARTLHLGKKYPFIISNPPFFENDLKSLDTQRNLALHGDALGLQDLLKATSRHLSAEGKFAVLLPWHRKEEFEKLAIIEGFHPVKEVSVKQSDKHPYFRVMFLLGRENIPVQRSEIVIREGDRYADAFTELLKDYYLKL